MAEGKAKRAKYMRDNTSRNAERQRKRVARKFGNSGKRVLTNREIRRGSGDFKPVNKVASLEQAPQGRYARSLSKEEIQKVLGLWVNLKNVQEIKA